MLRALLIPSRFPHRPRKIPEIHRLVIRDDKRLTIYLILLGNGFGGFRGGDQSVGSEEMGVRDVAHVGEVEEVVVVAELEAGFVGCVGGEGAWDQLDVAFAEDCCWADGAG